jgi:hypothetical protein
MVSIGLLQLNDEPLDPLFGQREHALLGAAVLVMENDRHFAALP